MPIVISVVDTWVLAKKKIDDNFDLISLQLHTNCMIVKVSSAVSGQRRVSQVHSRELETSPTLATTRTNPASSLRPARTSDSRAFSSSITEDIPKPNKQSTSDSSPVAHERPGARDSSPVRDLTRDSLRLDTADRSDVTSRIQKDKHRRMVACREQCGTCIARLHTAGAPRARPLRPVDQGLPAKGGVAQVSLWRPSRKARAATA